MFNLSRFNSDPKLKIRYIKTRLQGDSARLDMLLEQRQSIINLERERDLLLHQRKHNQCPDLGRELKQRLRDLQTSLSQQKTAYQSQLLSLPNIIDASVTTSKDIVTDEWGEKAYLDKKCHHGVIDLKDGAKLAKSKFPVLKGELALLHRALGQYMLDYHVRSGYEEYYLPYLNNRECLIGTGQLPNFENDLFKIEDMYLIPTGEVPLVNLYRNKLLSPENLPYKATALTPCFRREAGSYGKASQGMKRQHQFDKVEMVQVVHPDDALQALEKMVEEARGMLKELQLPHRVLLLGHDEIGFTASKTYDLEIWMPCSQEYLEVSSCSLCSDFQSRRVGCKISTHLQPIFASTLNGSGLAVGRTLIAMIEHHLEGNQLILPEVLVPYCLGKKYISL